MKSSNHAGFDNIEEWLTPLLDKSLLNAGFLRTDF